ATAAAILRGALRLLHPFMPYLTEELNEKIFASKEMMITQRWPGAVALGDSDAPDEIRHLISVISEIRYIRSEMNVPLSAKPVLQIRGSSELQARSIRTNEAALLRLARLGSVEPVDSFGKGTARGTVDGVDIGLPLAEILDLDAERARLEKAIVGVDGEITKISRKLDNPGFIAKAPAEVVNENRRRLDEEVTRRGALEAALARLA
ncbi:MAG: class I tRNA ligase family protein, partial [Rhodobiaceae bacterium]